MNATSPDRSLRGVRLLPAAVLTIWLAAGDAAVTHAQQLPRIAPAVAQGINLSTHEQALAYVRRHPADVSLVRYAVDNAGNPDPDVVAPINHGGNVPMPLGSTFKITVLAAYAQAIADQTLDPSERVPISAWEAFYLPDTDGGAHHDALAALGLAADEMGFAVDQSAAVPLDALASAMISVSDNAATDYLLRRLGRAAVASAIGALGMANQETPRSIVGTILSWDNHRDGNLDNERLARLLAMPEVEYAALVQELEDLYLDSVWRAEELAWRQRGGDTLDLWNQVSAAHRLTARGTAADYAGALAGVITATVLTPEACAVMRRHLEWPMRLPGIVEAFDALGTKGGSLLGVLTEATYLRPAVGPYTSQRFVCVIFFRNVPLLQWLKLTTTGAHQLFQLAVTLDPEFAARVEQALAGKGPRPLRPAMAHR